MKHPELLVIIGANGAGKTTWARKNRDLLGSTKKRGVGFKRLRWQPRSGAGFTRP